MGTPSSAAEIRERMALARADLCCNAQRLGHDAEKLTDWRYHVRRHPWLILGAASAVGFMLVPRRAKPVALDAETLSRLAEQRATSASDAATRPGLMSSVASLAAKALLRYGMAYVGQYVSQVVASTVAARTAAEQNGHGDPTHAGREPR